MSHIIANTYVGDTGWLCRSLCLPHGAVAKTDVRLELAPGRGETEPVAVAIESVEFDAGQLTIVTTPFAYGKSWTLYIAGERYTQDDVTDAPVEGLDAFAAEQAGDVLYRIYRPDCTAARPLILFLHGSGEIGYDNFTHMVGTVGALRLAELYPDMYILAPQAPGHFDPSKFATLSKQTFATSGTDRNSGWSRTYLAKVCDLIRDMIASGQVDPRRVYVTGMSMGGGGTLRAMSVGADLFAAAAPICPTMTPETYDILCSLVDAKLWISTAYVDHTTYRHKYIVDGILSLRDQGNRNAHLTLYSPEELEVYGIATDPDLSLKEQFAQNHASWILTYHNAHGILSWLTAQTK